MMALKPIENGKRRGILNIFMDKFISNERLIDLHLPNNVVELKLNRLYRCTVCIAQFYKSLLKSLSKSTFIHSQNRIINYSTSFVHGHQIYGKPPEVLLLPQCNCFTYCKSPLQHLLIENKTKILKLLKRIQSELKSIQITVIFGLYSSSIECINWLKEELRKEDLSILVKAIDECRGLEFPALVTISNDTGWGSRVHDDSSVADAWTRVTSTLVVINLDGKYHIFSEGLKDALKSKVAHRAVEQEDISYSYLKQMYFQIQHPLFIMILFVVMLLLMGYFLKNELLIFIWIFIWILYELYFTGPYYIIWIVYIAVGSMSCLIT